MSSTRPDDTAPENAARRTGTIVALGAVPVLIVGTVFLMGLGGDPDTTSINNEQTTTTTSPVFIDATAANTPASSMTPTTVTPTTTPAPAPTVLEAPLKQPERPIDPPLDPRGDEDHIELGGIAIPKLGIDTPLLEGIRLTTLDNGPGHWPGSAMPGEVGNVVVAGHRTSHDAPFRDLDQLVAGDVVEFTTAAGLIEYTVTGTQIVDPDAIWIVDPTDTPTATLFACHPPGSTRQRIVVNLELS